VLDGHHRLRAATELGLPELPVRIVEVDDELSYMLGSALQRRHLSPSQRAAWVVELGVWEQERAQGRARRRANLKGQINDVAALPHRGGRTRERLAKLAGVSPRLVQDAQFLREADPERLVSVQAGTLPLSRVAGQVRRLRRAQELVSPPLPQGPHELILADPPWQLGNPNGAFAPENHYPTLSLEELKQLQLPAAESSLLFLWAVNALLPQALELMASWGFAYRTNLVWVKPSIGLGHWFRNRHEPLLLGRRGDYPLPEPAQRADSVLQAPRGRHSQKPSHVYELIERMYPRASKLELFARQTRPGWSSWGNEVRAA